MTTDEQSPQIIYIYTTYTESKKKSLEKYRKSENGKAKLKEVQHRYYLNKKLRKQQQEDNDDLLLHATSVPII